MPSLPLLLRPFLRIHTPSTSPARGADSEVLRQEEVRPEGLRNASITGLARSLSRYKAWKHSGMTLGDHGHRRPGLKRFLLGGGTVYVPGGGRHSDAPSEAGPSTSPLLLETGAVDGGGGGERGLRAAQSK